GLRNGTRSQELDELFGVRYVGERGQDEAGEVAEAEKKKLPAKAVAVAQQVALWLPAAGRLLWQLGELANAHGDMRTAAAILDGCVQQFGMASDRLRDHRRRLRDAADALPQLTPGAKADHE